MTIAFDAMLDIARLCGPTVEGVASAGGATSITDTTALGTNAWQDGNTDDEFNGGTAFIVTDTAGAAPENETARITDYVASTGVVTVATGDFSAAPAASDEYSLTKIPRSQLLDAINRALRDLGYLPYEDDASLDTAASTREYTLPAAAKKDLREVWIASHTSAPYDYEKQLNWRQVLNKSTGDLVFTEQPRSGRNIRLVYCGPHAKVDDDADTIHDMVPADYLAWRGAYHILLRRVQEEGRDTQKSTGLMNQAAEYAAQALARHPVILPPRPTQFPVFPEPDLEGGAVIKTAEIPTS